MCIYFIHTYFHELISDSFPVLSIEVTYIFFSFHCKHTFDDFTFLLQFFLLLHYLCYYCEKDKDISIKPKKITIHVFTTWFKTTYIYTILEDTFKGKKIVKFNKPASLRRLTVDLCLVSHMTDMNSIEKI